MIKGIGIDIIELDRIAKAIERQGQPFIERLFTLNEQKPQDASSVAYYAGRFAAKEAIVKALGTGFRGISWHDIEILSDSLGKPYVTLSPQAQARFSNPQLLISISHSKTVATAFCIWQE